MMGQGLFSRPNLGCVNTIPFYYVYVTCVGEGLFLEGVIPLNPVEEYYPP